MDAQEKARLDSLLNQAVQAAKRRDLAQARNLANRGLSAEGEAALPFRAFLGMVEALDNNSAKAAEHLREAHRLRPNDVTIACNLLSTLLEIGHEEEALTIATADLMRADTSLRIGRMRGFLAQQREQFKDAVEAYEHVLARQPDDFESLNNLGNARAGLDDQKGAVAALRRAVDLDPHAAPTYLNLATALSKLDKLEEAEAVLKDASAKFPQDARPPYQLYTLFKRRQMQDAALAALLESASRDPLSAETQLKLAIEYGVVRDTARAEQAYTRAIELDPLASDAYLGLAIQYEHTNRENEFSALAELARTNGLPPDHIAFIEALELRRIGNFEEALAKLDQVPPDIEVIRTAHARATLLDRLNRTDEAFAAYQAANALMIADNPTDPLERAKDLRDRLRAEIAFTTAEWRSQWATYDDFGEERDPVFLVGFPRSGTTLLDTLLMGHPDTHVMEEQPPLNRVDDHLGGMEGLPQLSKEAVAEARALYFSEVVKTVGWDRRSLLVDKSPLFLYRLPLIQRLFPQAKIILALRHPCDVVLSCFMSNFRLNSAMSNFLRLDDAAEFYDLCFNHWDQARALFPDADVHTVTYERLIEDVEATLRPLVAWLGLEWHSSLLNHTATAKSRGLITTASYSQVTEPIYNRAKGRWMRYRHHLEPTFDTLGPWVVKLGYERLETVE